MIGQAATGAYCAAALSSASPGTCALRSGTGSCPGSGTGASGFVVCVVLFASLDVCPFALGFIGAAAFRRVLLSPRAKRGRFLEACHPLTKEQPNCQQNDTPQPAPDQACQPGSAPRGKGKNPRPEDTKSKRQRSRLANRTTHTSKPEVPVPDLGHVRAPVRSAQAPGLAAERAAAQYAPAT